MIAAALLWITQTLDLGQETVDLTGAEAVSLISMLECRSDEGKAWADAMIRCYAGWGGSLEDPEQTWTLECYLSICRYLDVIPSALLNR